MFHKTNLLMSVALASMTVSLSTATPAFALLGLPAPKAHICESGEAPQGWQNLGGYCQLRLRKGSIASVGGPVSFCYSSFPIEGNGKDLNGDTVSNNPSFEGCLFP